MQTSTEALTSSLNLRSPKSEDGDNVVGTPKVEDYSGSGNLLNIVSVHDEYDCNDDDKLKKRLLFIGDGNRHNNSSPDNPLPNSHLQSNDG